MYTGDRNGITDITVVVEYKADMLIRVVKEKCPNINVIITREYTSTNNMNSAYLVRDEFVGKSFLMMNADVFFDASVITSFMLKIDNYEDFLAAEKLFAG